MTVLSENEFLYWYMLILSAIAVISYIHYSWLPDYLHSRYKYKISYLKELPGDIWDIRLKARYRLLNLKAGQFAYLSFSSLPEKGYHPFTISSGIRSSELQFYIKELGDLTGQFNKLKKGQKVNVKGPYGGFTFNDRRYPNQLWIGAGIGITPFLSKARSLQHDRHIERVELIYATPKKTESFASKELQKLEENNKKFNYTLVPTTVFGNQSLRSIINHLKGFEDFSIYLCGPPRMIEAYEKQAEELGLSDRLFFEEFTF